MTQGEGELQGGTLWGARRALPAGSPAMGAVSELRGGRCGVAGHRCFPVVGPDRRAGKRGVIFGPGDISVISKELSN
jgi:hypothetical protein